MTSHLTVMTLITVLTDHLSQFANSLSPYFKLLTVKKAYDVTNPTIHHSEDSVLV